MDIEINMTGNKKNITRYSVVVFVGAMLFCMCMNLTGSVLNEIIADYELSLDSGGLMTFFQYIGGIIAIFVLLKIVDHMKKPLLLMMGFAIAGIMLLFIGNFPPLVLLIALYFIFGAALGMMDMLNNAVLSDIHPHNMAGVLCILHGICGLGAVLIPVITVVIGTANWRDTYRLVGLVALIISAAQLAVYFAGKNDIDSFYIRTPKTLVRESARGFFSDKDVWFVILSILFFGLSQGGVITWVVKSSREIFPEAGAFLWAISLSSYWLGATTCRLLMGMNAFLKQLNPRRVIIVGGVLAGIALMFGIMSGNYICFFIGVFLYGALSGGTLPHTVALMTGWYNKNTGLCSSVSFISLYSGFAISTMIMGIVAAAFGMRAMMIVPAVCAIMSGVIAIPISKSRNNI